MRRLIQLIVVLSVLVGGGVGWWLNHSLDLNAASVDLSVEPGTSARGVALAVSEAGVQVNPNLLHWWFRLSGDARRIKAGSYELEPGVTPRSLLRKLVQGEESLLALTIPEGLSFAQLREILANTEHLKQDTQGRSGAWIMEELGKPGVHPEGRFFPDTYNFAKGSSDLAVLKRAMRTMDKRLASVWSQRTADLPLKTADEALVLASIVEKETGRTADQAQIAGVFINRLRLGMLLQTDPTVIYGLGEKFDGNLRRRDLLADTPWNTYTRSGLPPTPISMPGKAALMAAVQPAPTKALYFVARGDGSSQFSASLEEHNRAVNKYQRGR